MNLLRLLSGGPVRLLRAGYQVRTSAGEMPAGYRGVGERWVVVIAEELRVVLRRVVLEVSLL